MRKLFGNQFKQILWKQLCENPETWKIHNFIFNSYFRKEWKKEIKILKPYIVRICEIIAIISKYF